MECCREHTYGYDYLIYGELQGNFLWDSSIREDNCLCEPFTKIPMQDICNKKIFVVKIMYQCSCAVNSIPFHCKPFDQHWLAIMPPITNGPGSILLKRKFRHFDEILVTGCAKNCQHVARACYHWTVTRWRHEIDTVSALLDIVTAQALMFSSIIKKKGLKQSIRVAGNFRSHDDAHGKSL